MPREMADRAAMARPDVTASNVLNAIQSQRGAGTVTAATRSHCPSPVCAVAARIARRSRKYPHRPITVGTRSSTGHVICLS
jgi:hypothetical protein